MKKCSKCRIEKPAEAFAVEVKRKDGLCSWCRECKNAAYRARAAVQIARQKEKRRTDGDEGRRKRREAYQADADDRRRKLKEYRAANPEKVKAWEQAKYERHAEKIRDRNREYAQRNRAHRNEVQKRWWQENRESALEAKRQYMRSERGKAVMREYRLAHPELYAAVSARAARRREERLANLPTDFTTQDVRFGMRWWEQRCAVCDTVFDAGVKVHWDHWIPAVSPACLGTVPTNMVPLCDPCNRRKHALAPPVFVTRRVGSEKAAG